MKTHFDKVGNNTMQIAKYLIKPIKAVIITTGLLILLLASVAIGEWDTVSPENRPRLVGQRGGITSNLSNLSGYWELRIKVYRDTSNSGRVEKVYDLLAFLNQNSTNLTGDFVATSSDACKNVDIRGEVRNNQVSWVQTYKGSCCQNAQIKFDGRINSNGTLEGKFTPIGVPPSNCTLWWADVTATRRPD